ncbi:redoxin domain-containing protein [Rhodopirellula baltica]|nr:redoxin domain-containing protein [Rhodopirellula baltica]
MRAPFFRKFKWFGRNPVIATVLLFGVSVRFLLVLGCFLALGFQFALSQERLIEGRVVDDEGKPVANASVAPFWRANGSSRKSDGTPFDLSDKIQLHEFWGRIGEMESDQATKTNGDGSFTIALNWRDRALFAMDADRNFGCIVSLTNAERVKDAVVLHLIPLVTVKGQFRSSVKSKSIGWAHAYVELPVDSNNPLASNRLISCGSFEGRFEVRLPPGEYRLDAYAVSDVATDVIDLRVNPAPSFTVRATDTDLDIDLLELTLAPPGRQELEAEAKQEGRWEDYTKHYGEPAPDWNAVGSRGIDHQDNIAGLRGKWVLLDFWGLSCAPCLGHGIPKMMDFYEKNARSKSRFEIVGVCIDFTGEINDIAKLEKELSNIEDNVWKGQKIPFPIVLDNTFKTWERYGIPGLGTVVLIDPDGNIVEGDESTLQAVLDRAEPSDESKSR